MLGLVWLVVVVGGRWYLRVGCVRWITWLRCVAASIRITRVLLIRGAALRRGPSIGAWLRVGGRRLGQLLSVGCAGIMVGRPISGIRRRPLLIGWWHCLRWSLHRVLPDGCLRRGIIGLTWHRRTVGCGVLLAVLYVRR